MSALTEALKPNLTSSPSTTFDLGKGSAEPKESYLAVGSTQILDAQAMEFLQNCQLYCSYVALENQFDTAAD